MNEPAERVRLVRDRPTWLIYLQVAAFGSYLYCLSAALPLLRRDQGVSQTVAGLHGTSMAVFSVLTGAILAVLISRLGRRAVTWLGLAGMNAGVLLVLAAEALPLTLLGYGLASGFGGVTLYAGMAALSDHHGPAGPAAISEANAVGVTAGIVVSYALSAAASSALGWRTALLIPPAVTALLALTMGRTWFPAHPPPADPLAADPGAGPERAPKAGPPQDPPLAPTPSQGPATDGRRRFGWRFHAAGAVLFCCVAMEFGFNLWTAELITARTGMAAATAATALTAFTVGVAAGRFAGSWLALRFGPGRLLVGALAVTGVGWTLVWVSTHPVPAYAGLVVCGLGVSLHFPLSLARVIDAAGDRPDQGVAVAQLCGSVALGVGPFVLGALADAFGTHAAFLLMPALISAAIGGVLVARHPREPRAG